MNFKAEVLRSLRRIIGRKDEEHRSLDIQFEGQAGNDLIREVLLTNQPCMIGRFGSNELDATIRALEQRNQLGGWQRIIRYVRGQGGMFWWDSSIRKRMNQVAGFFPPTDDSLQRFGERILDDCTELDILASWRTDEWRVRPLFEHAKTINLLDLEPFRYHDPWTKALRGKKVLVVHPFEESIRRQYDKRSLLYPNSEILPEFELLTLKSVQSNGANDVPFASWFEALDFMCTQIEALDFDIAIIGAGAYGLPLAAYVKRMQRQAVHLGGITQLLFGIRGKRWDNGDYDSIFNEHWCRPLETEKPPRADLVEQGTYW